MTLPRALGLAVAAALLIPALAAAHPRVVDTRPAAEAELATAPRVVVVRLSEPADPVGQGITITGPDGRDVARGPVVVSGATLTRALDARAQGTYVVEWLVVGDDTHPSRGSFLFSVGEPTRAAVPDRPPGGRILTALGRWLSLLGFALGFGVVFAALLSGGMTARCWRLVSTGVMLLIVAEPVALLGQIALLAPARLVDLGFAADVLLTRYGHLSALRLAGALGLWALAGAVRTGLAARSVGDPGRSRAACVRLRGLRTSHRRPAGLDLDGSSSRRTSRPSEPGSAASSLRSASHGANGSSGPQCSPQWCSSSAAPVSRSRTFRRRPT